ncbi:MAG: hypothetical protein R3B06_13255 [Kofleriaceae bacterium]
MARVVLLYSPASTSTATVSHALTERGWLVQSAATLAECQEALAGGTIDLAVLDDPSWAQARELVQMLEAGPAAVPRVWVSSWPEAPAHSAKLGVDALMLDPTDVDGIALHLERLKPATRTRSTTGSRWALGSSPALHPMAPRDFDDEPTGER